MSWDAGGYEFLVVLLTIVVVVVLEVESIASFTWCNCEPGRSWFGVVCRLGWGMGYKVEETENTAIFLGRRANRGWDDRAEESPCNFWGNGFVDGGIVL